MSPRKRNSLFDAIASNRRADRASQVRVPDWWNAPKRGTGRSTRAAAATDPPQAGGNAANWLAQPWRMTMPRALWILVLATMAGITFLAYQMGRSTVPTVANDQTDARSAERLAEARRQDVNPLLLSQERRDDGADSAGAAAPTSGDGLRVAGLNYFCLETMPERYKAEAERAAGFLRRNGVDAAIIPVQNGRIQLIALRGFDKAALGGRQAREYENLLRSLGRAWKLEHQGWSDWSDLYAVKYTGR